MKRFDLTKVGRKDWSFMFLPILLLLMLFSPGRAQAYDFMWDDNKYMFISMGTSVSIEIPIYDKEGRDMWAIDGYIYVSASGKQEQTLLHYKSEKNISNSAKYNNASFDTSIGGILKVKDASGSWVRLSNNIGTVPIYSSGDHFTAVLEWEAPYEWRGMALEFRVKVHGDQNAWKEWNKEWKKTGVTLSEPPSIAKPSIMTSMLAAESGHYKEVSIMWQIAASEVTSAKAYYKANGVSKSITLPNETFGTVYVPSDQLINDFYVKVDYLDSEKKKQTDQESSKYDVPYFHQAKDVRTKLFTDGRVELSWKVDNPTRTDILQTDFWLIQRNTRSSMEDDEGWTTIGQESFKQNEEDYKFIDETLTNVYENKTVYYRVQRAAAAGNWGYGSQSGAGNGVLLQRLALPDILSTYVLKSELWGKNDKHTVSVYWSIDKNTNNVETPTLYLSNRSDWEELCILVSKGYSTINAVMLNDIDIDDCDLMLGDKDMPFKGTFDGDDYMLTVNYNTSETYSAPFRYAQNAVIKNLHTAGTINTSAKFAAGIVAHSEDVTISNCWSSIEINSSVNGDGTHGGIVSHAYARLTIEDCLFDGKLLGSNTTNCGGILGWRESTNSTEMYRTVFNPGSVTISTNGSGTLYRNKEIVNGKLNLESCFFTRSLGEEQGEKLTGSATLWKQLLGKNWAVINNKCVPHQPEVFHIGSQSDWNTFVSRAAEENTINAILDNDITLDNGSQIVTLYAGIFDGKGHTITINFSDRNAMFDRLSGATIKNLYIAGRMTGEANFSCLAGTVQGTSPSTILNCQCSVSFNYSAGYTRWTGCLVRGVENGSKLFVSNTLFDGEISCQGNDNSGFVGATSGTGSVKFTNCLFNPRQLTVNNTFSTFIAPANTGITIDSCYYTKAVGVNQGKDASTMTLQDLKNALGSQWMLVSNEKVKPIVNLGDQARTFIWDNNALMKLYTDKYVNDTLRYTDERIITESERKEGKLELELLSPCVDYGFRVTVERGSSPLHISTYGEDVTTRVSEVPVAYIPPILPDGAITIGSAMDWEDFVTQMNKYSDSEMKSYYVVLTDDIDLGDSQAAIGLQPGVGSTKFRGTFDGQGHSLTVNYTSCSAPFYRLENATIKNLHVKGNISNGLYIGGIALRAESSSIENCRVSAQLNLTSSALSNPGLGGLVTRVESGTVTIQDCVFDGSISIGHSSYSVGGLVGATYIDAKAKVTNCVFKPSSLPSSSNNGATLIMSNSGYNSVEISNCYYTKAFGKLQGTDASVLSENQLLAALGSNWKIVNNQISPAWPKRISTLYFDNNVKMDSLKAEKQHSSVLLKWWTNGGDADHFEVHRRDLTTKTGFECIAENVKLSSYIDKTAKAHHEYEYLVKAIVQCEGIHEESLTCLGNCDNFGRVSGFVRMPNGTGIGGITVKAIPDDLLKGVGVERSVITDNTGYFMIDSLFYLPNNGLYTIQVQVTGDAPDYTSATCNFSEDKNEFTNAVLALREYYVFSGKVLYEGTSIPVPGAQFRLDGKPLYNYQQKRFETDNQGSFSINVPAGTHKIQVEKEGHVFEYDGYYIDRDNKADSTEHNWQRNISGVYLWDQTRVTLRGRMVGGDVQGQKPLGQSLSYNNLGHDLKMVMQLEGDNTSWIVRDPLNLSIKERKDSLRHGAIDPKTRLPKDMTRWEMDRHSITIHPDEITGEYEVKLFPVKYKIVEQSCTGYSTLFQAGKVGETLDLTNVTKDSIAEYKCVYHSPVKLDVRQINISGESCFGDSFYLAEDINNAVDTVKIWTPKTATQSEKYVLGHPVFMSNASYLFNLQAQEEYPFENRTDTVPDIVPLHEGTVYFHNDLIGNDVTDSVRLDSVGRGIYQFIPKNTTFIGNDESSLRTLDINLLYDGVYYDIKPFNNQELRAYVMGAVPAANGRQVVSKGGTHLIDILRDPPGSGSSAYIESGSKLKYSYTVQLDGKIGLTYERTQGTGSNFYQGIWGGSGSGTAVGTITNASTKSLFSFSLGVKCGGTWVYSYEMTTTNRIQTSSDVKWVGPKADIYIGMTDNIVVGQAVAVRMVPESQFEKLKLRTNGKIQLDGHAYDIKDGTVQVLATGTGADGKKVYLISDEVYNYYATFNSEFIHTGEYIEKELIPNILKLRNERLLPKGVSEADAQAMANRDNRTVYLSLVDATDPEFGYDASLTENKNAKYKIFYPKGVSTGIDEIAQYNNEVITWVSFLAQNEKEKVQAAYKAQHVKNIDFDGAANIQYSESFSTSDDYTRYLRFEPFTLSINGLGADIVSNTLEAASMKSTSKGEGEGQTVEVSISAGQGAVVKATIKPVVTIDYSDKNGKSVSSSKKAGFTLNASSLSNLNISVYRSVINRNDIEKDVKAGNADVFLKATKETLDVLRGGWTKLGIATNLLTYASNNEPIYGNFIFQTNGGATAGPWEDERKTKYYQPGTVYDQKTVRIDQLRIWAEKSIVSNVPYGEAARYTIYLCNESPAPAKASPTFVLSAPDAMNQKGAQIMFNGNVLNGSGYNVILKPGEVVAKEIEVRAGSSFDYEDLGICLYDPNDRTQAAYVKLSAHFIPSAGKIAISTPGDKWVVNTESPYDEEQRGYYMPVRIEGFNVNQRNFDHIELQYKLSTQGDKDWVNICSYYKSDSLMELANGTCRLIENDGYIMARFFGEKDPVEQYYDLRAVVYCRNGNGFLTTSSPILSGVKDTRRPQPFGTPKPVNGILGIGDDITISFSEPIASNYLSTVNNFEVLGLTNSGNITQGTCLRFSGTLGALALASRNFSEKSFSLDVMVNPDEHTKSMGIFQHGNIRNSIQAGLSADNRMMVVFNQKVYYSSKPVQFSGLHQIIYTFSVDKENRKTTISFYDGNTNIGTVVHDGLYQGIGSLLLGGKLNMENADGGVAETEGFRGTMLEVRVWNKTLAESDIKQYAKKHLTGYELGLLDNYPLNEGIGKISYNKAVGGSDLQLLSATWSVPAGLSVKLDGKKGVVLNDSAFVRRATQDYTLMFWFRTNDDNGTLLANGPALNESQWKHHFNIGLKDGKVYYRNGRMEVTSGNLTFNDGGWHHLAVTVNRSRNVGNLYVDQKLLETFSTDTLGGILGGTLAAGITYEDAHTTSSALTGNIDEVALYEMTLPLNVIKDYAFTTPLGRELGTLVYLPFSHSEKQKSNEQRLVASGKSIKQSRDNQGNYSTRMDVIVPDSVMNQVSDRDFFAPIDNSGQRENLNYSYVADKQNLLINIDEPAVNLEKTNVYITVRDVADLNGNLMEAPVMMDLYVYRNPLRWKDKRIHIDAVYGQGTTIDVTVQNLSGKTHAYYLDNQLLWITPSKTSGTIAATDEETITLNISPFTNIGDFDEVLNLVSEEGMNEPLPIHIKVRGETPEWAVGETLQKRNIAMNIVARVKIDDVVADDADDIIGVFGNGHEPMGVAHLSVDNTANANETLAFMSVYNTDNGRLPLHIEYFDASTGRISVLKPEDVKELVFIPDTIIGTTSNPIVLVNTDERVQTLHLKKGWNWSSFFVKPDKSTISNLLNRATKWEVGDALEVLGVNGFYEISYKGIPDRYNPSRINYYWDNGNDSIEINATAMYRFYSHSDKSAYLSGHPVYEPITVYPGWNRIAFTSSLNLPISTALADYTDDAEAGDIIKSQDAFAVLTKDAQNNRFWKGTLTHLTAGQGYMIKHQGSSTIVFSYPIYESNSRYGNKSYAPLFENTTANSMNIIATTQGVDLQEGDRLLVFNGAELCGKTELMADDLFFLTVAECNNSRLSFAIERDGQLIAVSGEQMNYKTNAVMGTIEMPTVINFATINRYADGQWYDMQGRKLAKRPQRKGVYIYNGQKTIIE